VGRGVIFSTYDDLRSKAGLFEEAIGAFRIGPTDVTLDAARSAWRAARVPWESSEGFLFGPVSDEGLDPAIDSWPVNEVDLDAVLASSETLTAEFVASLANELKGFHTLEYLLFGTSGSKPVAAFTPREQEYLDSAAANLRAATTRLAEGWDPDGEDFGRLLAEPGPSNPRYSSYTAAVQEVLEGAIGICDEVANGKINDPFTQQDVTLEESRFSRNSIDDFQNNIRSVQNVYVGTVGDLSGPGLSDFVASLDEDLDGRVRVEIQAAIDAIGAIPAPFTTAITEHPAAVSAAQTAVRTLLETLDRDVRGLLGSVEFES
jgi:predicted lipoprotein